jgi:recombinational DNA repair ATPase RecF
MSGGYLLYSAPNLKNTYIKQISPEAQQPFIALADQMLSLNAQLQQKRQRFIHRLQESLGVQKITSALERFDEVDFKTIQTELKKQKISLSFSQQDDLEDYFNKYKTECNAISAQIAATDKEIDQMVYQLYGLTEDEIKVVEG